jgi:hypothetical protein
MSVAFPSSTAFTSSDAAGGNPSVSAPVPSGLVAGDLWIIVAVQDSDASAVLSTPSGFTAVAAQVGSNANVVKAWYKYAAGGDSAVTVSGTHGYVLWGVSIRVTGMHASAPIGNVGTPVDSNATSKNIDAPDVTIAAAGSGAIMVAAAGSTTGGTTAVTPPSGATSFASRDGSNVYPTAGVAYELVNAGSFAPGNWSMGAGTNYEARVGVTFEIVPAAGSPTGISNAHVAAAAQISGAKHINGVA